jgi:hypothetical protein
VTPLRCIHEHGNHRISAVQQGRVNARSLSTHQQARRVDSLQVMIGHVAMQYRIQHIAKSINVNHFRQWLRLLVGLPILFGRPVAAHLVGFVVAIKGAVAFLLRICIWPHKPPRQVKVIQFVATTGNLDELIGFDVSVNQHCAISGVGRVKVGESVGGVDRLQLMESAVSELESRSAPAFHRMIHVPMRSLSSELMLRVLLLLTEGARAASHETT